MTKKTKSILRALYVVAVVCVLLALLPILLRVGVCGLLYFFVLAVLASEPVINK